MRVGLPSANQFVFEVAGHGSPECVPGPRPRVAPCITPARASLRRELELALSHDCWDPVEGREELWARLIDLLHQNPQLRTFLTIPPEVGACSIPEPRQQG